MKKRVFLVFMLLMVFLYQAQPAQAYQQPLPFNPRQSAGKPNFPYYYYFFSTPTALTPVPGALVVRTADQSAQAVTDALPGASGTTLVATESDLKIVHLAEKTSLAQAETSLESLRQSHSISYASLIYQTRHEWLIPTGSVAFKMKAGESAQSVDAALRSLGLVREPPSLYDAAEYAHSTFTNADPVKLAAALYETGRFEFVEPSFIHYQPYGAEESAPPVQLASGPQNMLSESKGWNITAVHADDAWNLLDNWQPYSVSVAVIDTGVERTHEDLYPALQGIRGYDAVNDIPGMDQGGPPSTLGNCFHGTAMAGVIAATRDNGKGNMGVASNFVRIIPIRASLFDPNPKKACYDITDQALSRAIMFAVGEKAAVINMSLSNPGMSSAQVFSALKTASANGVVVVGASGNNCEPSVNSPSFLDSVIAVGAYNNQYKRWQEPVVKYIDGEKLCGSSYGAALDITAPGVYYPLLDLMGTGGSVNGNYTEGAGTSPATAVVSATAALLKLVRPNLNPYQIQDIIQRTAYKMPGYDFSDHPELGGRNDEVGFGSVNVYEAIRTAIFDATLSFQIHLESLTVANHAAPVALAVFAQKPNKDGSYPLMYYNEGMASDANGYSTFNATLTGVASGDYMACAKPKHYLWHCKPVHITTAIKTNVDFTEGGSFFFTAGDFNRDGEDGAINAADYEVFRRWSFDCMHTVPTGLCTEVDLNRSNYINTADNLFINRNYNKQSDHLNYVHALRPFHYTYTFPAAPSLNVTATASASAYVQLYSTAGAPSVGGDYPVSVYADLSGIPVGAGSANLIIRYDPGVWDVIDTNPNVSGIQVSMSQDIFPQNDGGLVNTAEGKITLGSFTDLAALTGSTNSGLLAVLPFRAKAGTSNTRIYAEWVSGETADSNISELSTGYDVVSDMYDLQVAVSGGPARPMPAVQLSLPSDSYVNSMLEPLSADVSDPYNQVYEVGFYVVMPDQSFIHIGSDTVPDDGWQVDWDTSGLPDQIVSVCALAFLPGDAYGWSCTNQTGLDRTPPTYIDSTFHKNPQSGLMETTLAVSDNLSLPQMAELYINTAADGSDSGDWVLAATVYSSFFTWDPAPFTPGFHQATFAIKDFAGNWNRGTPRLIIPINTSVMYLPLVRK